MRLVKVDYQDGLGGAMHYILHSQTKAYEYISKDAFCQIVEAAKEKVINTHLKDGCIVDECFLTF